MPALLLRLCTACRAFARILPLVPALLAVCLLAVPARAQAPTEVRIGLLAKRGSATITQAPPPVTPVRVTGAGDNFVAAHLAAELNGATRAEALAAAVNFGAAYVAGKEHP